jgi:hypothetical protein
MAVDRTRAEGGGWITFAGIMLIVAGAIDFFNGIWALGASDTSFDTIFWDGNLDAWGVFYLILGLVLIFAGFGIFQRATWAVAVGIIVSAVAAILNMFWVFAYPIASLVLIILNVLILYALIVYGTGDRETAR